MDISRVKDLNNYTHVHFAFANITSDWKVDVSGVVDQFEKFTVLSNVKRIISFGGWGFSTDPGTYTIFREGVTEANRQTVAANIANFVMDFSLDGVDFDWEYPGAQDIPGISPDSVDSGANYAAFLSLVRGALPTDKTISMALPASYWYLKGFDPLSQFDSSVSYYVFMTYDLHGQWDYGNQFTK